MSLSARDRRALDLIGEGLAGSDPHLAAMLSAFSRLADGEAMPGRERIQAGRQRMAGRALRATLAARPGRCWRRLAAQRPKQHWVALTWLVMSLVLITLTLVASHIGSSAACAGWTVPACGNHAPTHRQSRSAHGFPG